MESELVFNLDGTVYGAWSAVHEAAANSNLEAMKILLRDDPRYRDVLNVKTMFFGETPLALALDNPATTPDMIQLLLDAGSDVHYETRRGTPLRHAVHSGNLDIVRLLVAAGACVDGKLDPDGDTALHYAVDAKNMEMLRYFSDICDWRVVNNRMKPALYCACYTNFTEGVQLLLNYVDDYRFLISAGNGFNLLNIAVYNNNKKIVEMLLVASPKLTMDFTSHAVKCCMMSGGNLEVWKFLVDTSLDTVLDVVGWHLLEMVPNQMEYILQVLQNHEDCDELERGMLSEITMQLGVSIYNMDFEVYDELKDFFQCHFTYEPGHLFCIALETLNHDKITAIYFIKILGEIGVRGCWNEKQTFLRLCGDLELTDTLAEPRDEALANLQQPVLDLKRLSAMAARAHIRNYTGSNWMARLMVQESALPRICKQQLFLDFAVPKLLSDFPF